MLIPGLSKRIVLGLCINLIGCFAVLGQENIPLDTTRTYSIPEIVVTERYSKAEMKSTAPLQILSANKLEQLNVLQVSDAVKHFSGATVRDYGGIGGLKTVSVRSLGANHTAVNYDGVVVSDVQTGQIDIGRFSLDNVEVLSLINGQSDDIFQPARAFASGAVLNIRTQVPDFESGKYIRGKVSMKAGSFGFLNPALNVEGKISKKLSASLSGEYQYAHGEYPFILHYGNTDESISVTEKRKNTDVENLRLEGAVYGNFSDKSKATVRAYYYQSERGLPGAAIFYNLEQNSGQRTWDKTFFAQAHYEYEFSGQLHMQVNGKYNWNRMRYLDPKVWNQAGKIDNTYSQQEYYLSASLLYRVFRNLSFSFSTDGAVNTMDANLVDFVRPVRYSWISVLAAKYAGRKVSATASLLSTAVKETVKSGVAPENQFRLSPYASISVKPFEDYNLRFRAFYKHIFRLPTFNDLYYTNIGNVGLKPETTHQYNVGLAYDTSLGTYIPVLSVTVDAYHNNVHDKIVAKPTQNIFVWSMKNYGKVSINGLDLTAQLTVKPHRKIAILAGTSYTYQRALNVTDPSNIREYKHQIPYTPRVSGSAMAGVQTDWINVYYSLVWSGHRYVIMQNYAENRLEGYADHSISLSRDFNLSVGILSASFEVLNLSNKNYEIIQWFPMPGRSFRTSVSLKF